MDFPRHTSVGTPLRFWPHPSLANLLFVSKDVTPIFPGDREYSLSLFLVKASPAFLPHAHAQALAMLGSVIPIIVSAKIRHMFAHRNAGMPVLGISENHISNLTLHSRAFGFPEFQREPRVRSAAPNGCLS